MRVKVRPNPFDPAGGFEIYVEGGDPPYEFIPEPDPPNPPGVVVAPQGNTAHVDVPPSTPSGTDVYITVRDSSGPPPREVTVVATTI